jgi:2-C-methyl-D-erythritol 4-phosphate cytidylyltransferase / 2-C-methyl-D-erythritol 2,4-cyclodiphosphate synthase
VTDDAACLERAGHRVGVVEGETGNFKITTDEDLRRAESILAMRRG